MTDPTRIELHGRIDVYYSTTPFDLAEATKRFEALLEQSAFPDSSGHLAADNVSSRQVKS